MKLVVGLGNPGSQYNFTRHNTGFLALDFYLKVKGVSWEKAPKFGAEWVKVRADELRVGKASDAQDSVRNLGALRTSAREDVIFVKPQDFYNLSGKAVKEFARYYKIVLDDVLVVCDDFNLPFGIIRYRENGSAGGNNGLKSVISELQSENFPRVRVGTGNPELRGKIGDTDFVLGKFTTLEKAKLPGVLRDVEIKLDEILR